MNEQELALRRALGISDDAQQVLILEQSAHCDWDWVATFEEYYAKGGGGHQAVKTTLEQAVALIGGGSFRYVFCEAGYLQAFIEDASVPPDTIAALEKAAKERMFHVSSGGITSAENLMLHTEAFIRNYLVGRQWVVETFGISASNQLWIPDDFGQDAQLPALIQAMGFTGVGFERIPAQTFAPATSCVAAATNMPSRYLPASVGLDFIWQATDGSQVQAHWLSGGYCAGNSALGGAQYGGGTISASNGTNGLKTLIGQNTVAATPGVPYMFSPIDCDFTAPYTNLHTVIANWNNAPAIPGVEVVLASFDHFMKLVANSSMELQTLTTTPDSAFPFVPHPYYSGSYGSRPLLKRAHFVAVRTLLLAESMQVILQATGRTDALQPLADAWNLLLPSTHHDYITGTSPNAASTCAPSENVYGNEQVPLLDEAVASAEAVKEDVLGQIAALQQRAPTVAGDSPVAVVVFNAVGFERRGIAHLPRVPAGGPFLSSTTDFETYNPVQNDGEGGLLVLADSTALGYTTVFLSRTAPNATDLRLSASQSQGTVTLASRAIRATIDSTGITALTDPLDASTPNYLRAPATVVFYNDRGNIYRFGMEIPCPPVQFELDESLVLSGAVTLIESGPLRARAVATSTVGSQTFTVTYELYATDTAVRVTVSGAAPQWYSVMARVPFTGTAASLTYGTTAHWDTQAPRNAFVWTPPSTTQVMTFEPTHEFVAPLDAGGQALGAVYHYATPGWAIDSDGAIVGCILRNTPGSQQAACGSDPDTHIASFALAIPIALQQPAKGAAVNNAMLAEAMAVNNPLEARAVPSSTVVTLPRFIRIAEASDRRALVTVAKAGQLDPSTLILRIYQPTNAALTGVEVKIDTLIASNYRNGSTLVAGAVTALEEPSTASLNLSTEASSVTLDLPYAITTIALGTGS